MTEHWNAVMEIEGIERAVKRAAERTQRDFPWTDREDLAQVAWECLGTRPQLLEATHPEVLTDWLHKDLIDSAKGHALTVHCAEEAISMVGLVGMDREFRRPYAAVIAEVRAASESECAWQEAGGGYSRAKVQYLLISLWDECYGYAYAGLTKPGLARPQMRHPAMVADIRSAWAEALTTKQREAMLLTTVIGWTQAQAAVVLGVSQEAVSGRVDRGMDRMLDYLNREAPTRESGKAA
jgi:predicted DNA-binding protein (UPF0251 family)